jgi:hypothetical protein
VSGYRNLASWRRVLRPLLRHPFVNPFISSIRTIFLPDIISTTTYTLLLCHELSTLPFLERTTITKNPYATERHIYTMSRRALMSVPRAISASVHTSVRPSLASHTASPFLRPAIIQPSQKRSYHEKVLDHYSNPRNVGSMDKNAGDVGTGTSKSQIILCPSSAPWNARVFGHRMSQPTTMTIADLSVCYRPRWCPSLR